MAKLTSDEVQRFIMNCGYFAKPEAKPTIDQRFYHAGSAQRDMWALVGDKRTPAYSRIEKQFEVLCGKGWIRSAEHPEYPTVWGWMLTPTLVAAYEFGEVRTTADLFDVDTKKGTMLRMLDVPGVRVLEDGQ